MLSICEINRDNVFDVCELTSNPDGVGTLFEEFICCNAISISESAFYPECKSRAIYLNQNAIGFFMYKQFPNTIKEAEICRFMLDHKYIGKGFGRQSFSEILAYLRKQNIEKTTIMIDAKNHIAKNLYISFGFSFTGRIEKDEYFYSLIF